MITYSFPSGGGNNYWINNAGTNIQLNQTTATGINNPYPGGSVFTLEETFNEFRIQNGAAFFSLLQFASGLLAKTDNGLGDTNQLQLQNNGSFEIDGNGVPVFIIDTNTGQINISSSMVNAGAPVGVINGFLIIQVLGAASIKIPIII